MKTVVPRSRKKIVIVTLLAILIIATALVALLFFDRHQIQTTPTVTDEYGAPQTYSAQSEGKDIQVPTNVDSSQIKNYQLITENEQYKIRLLDSTYTITLYAIINRPDQYDSYQDQLREYKQNALNYLKKSGVDVTKVKIIYEPKEAENL